MGEILLVDTIELGAVSEIMGREMKHHLVK